MTTAVVLPTTHTEAPAQPVVAVRRRTVDRVLIALGGVAAIVLAVAHNTLPVAVVFDFVNPFVAGGHRRSSGG